MILMQMVNLSLKPSPGARKLVTGYEKIADVPAGTTTYTDDGADRLTNYYYYVIAVGQPQQDDPNAINGTPGGVPLHSSRYLGQSYLPATLKRQPYGATGTVRDARIVPNPVNLGAEDGVRFNEEDRVAFLQYSATVYDQDLHRDGRVDSHDRAHQRLW